MAPVILAAAHDVGSNIFEIRLGRPLRVLHEAGFIDLRVKSLHDICEIDLLGVDALILQREVNKDALRILQCAHWLMITVIFEIDDLLTEPPPFLSIFEGAAERSLVLRRVIEGADFVSVSTERLKTALAEGGLVEKFEVTPNYAVPWSSEEFDRAPRAPSGPVTLIFASSDAVLIDFMLPPVRYIMEKFGDGVAFLAIGALAAKIEGELPNCRAYPTLQLNDFKLLLSTVENPVGLIPLDNSLFSSCKTAVKYFDYASLGIPVICSNVPPYQDVVHDGKTGLLVENDAESWIRAMESLVTSRERRLHVGASARDSVARNFTLTQNTLAWKKILRMAMSQQSGRLLAKSSVRHRLRLGKAWVIGLSWGPMRITLRNWNRRRKQRKAAVPT